MRNVRHRMQGAVFWSVFCLLSVLLTVCSGKIPAAAQEEGKIKVPYQVFFVDCEDENTDIFYPQEGSVPEGTVLKVSFPEQMIGSDGHIWKSTAESPQEFPVYQYGVHKYFISYQKGKKIRTETEPEGELCLQAWLLKSWKADCEITGQDPDSMRNPYLTGETKQEQDQRIRQLVSQIADTDWHSFYLIGKNYSPQADSVGIYFDAVYSSVKEERFFVGEDWYQVLWVRVKRRFRPETCTHQWSLTGREAETCLMSGQESWKCSLCKLEETVCLPAAGHQDPEDTGSCIRCGIYLDEEAKKETGERMVWKKGDIQIRMLGELACRFVCVDEDYRSESAEHKTEALFLCDSVIRADADSTPEKQEVFSFGETNNYKTSFVRAWLKKAGEGQYFQAEPVSIGVNRAYTGSTERGSGAQLSEDALRGYEIPYQWMTDSVFLLSVEEALRYREELWDCKGQESAYSQGYYLRTPYYEEGEQGYQDGKKIYIVDFERKNIHPAETDSRTYGLRPAFALPQG